MKRKFNLMVAVMLMGMLSCAQNSISHQPSIAQTLKHLQIAVNDKDFSEISEYLSDNYEYDGIKRPMSVNILKQVIEQFPRMDSIVVIKSDEKESNLHLNVKLYNANGISDKNIILDSDYKIIQANIANISLQGHGSKQESANKSSTTTSPFQIIPFWLTDTGHMVVEAVVNGKKGNYVVDSGTPESLMLNSEYNDYEGVELSKAPLGVSGQMNDAVETIVKNFIWNDIEYNDIKALSANLDHLGKRMNINLFAGTIGYGILKDFIVEFDYLKKRLILWENSISLKDKYKITTNQIVPMSMAFHIPVIKVKIGDKEIRLGIDSGAQGNMLEKKWENELRNDYNNLRHAQLGGAENNYVDIIKVSMKNLWVNEKYYEMDFVFGDLFGGNHEVVLVDGLLGYSFLSYQKTAINYKDNELYFLD